MGSAICRVSGLIVGRSTIIELMNLSNGRSSEDLQLWPSVENDLLHKSAVTVAELAA